MANSHHRFCDLSKASFEPCFNFAHFPSETNDKGQKRQKIGFGHQVFYTYGSTIAIGNYVTISERSFLSVGLAPEALLEIAEGVWISRDFHLECNNHVRIGDNSLIGEFVSIRDTTHSFDLRDVPIQRQRDKTGSIIIEDDVWIGRGCLIQAKSGELRIGKGSIIGAHSVVTKSIPPLQVWAGAPARFIRDR